MSDPEPIDLSQLQNLNLAPDWVGDLQKREAAPGEVIWGRAPDHERESRGGGQGQGYGGGGGGRGPRRDGGGFGQDRNGPPRGPRPGGPGGPGGFGGAPRGPRPEGQRGPSQENRGPCPGGPGGFGGPGGPRPEGPRGPRPDGPRGPRQDDRGPRPDGPRGPRQDDRGPRPGGPPRDVRGPRPDRREGGGGRPDFRNDRRSGPPGRFDDRPFIEPLPGWRVRLFAEPKSLEAIVRQIKASSRAYPVFELGRLFLAGRDRYLVNFSRLPAPQPQRGPKNPGPPAPEPPASPSGPEQLFHIPADGSLWITRDEAIRHIINGPALRKLYRQETLTIDPPKGTFTAVAVCGFSGTILGPPNHHSFQTTVARLHREQFYNLPLDRYKSRIRTEKDETLVAKWLEEQSTTTVFIPLTPAEIAASEAALETAKTAPDGAETVPATAETPPDGTEIAAQPSETEVSSPETAASVSETEVQPSETAAPPETEAPSPEIAAQLPETEAPPAETVDQLPETDAQPSEIAADDSPIVAETALGIPTDPLKTVAAMEAHFIEHHAPGLIKAVTRLSVPGNIPGKLLAPPLLALLRAEVEQQRRFPMQLVQDLCRDLEKENLKFFKRDKKATFVCRTRPHFIEDESHLSPRLRSIVGVVKANPSITVSKLVSVLAPHAPTPPKSTTALEPAQSPEAAAAPVPTEAIPPADAALPPTSPPEVIITEAPASESVIAPPEPTLDPPAESTVESTVSAALPPTETTATADPGAIAPDSPSAERPAESKSSPPGREENRNRRPKGPKPPPAPPAPPAPLTSEEIGVLQDLRWLVQEGFVTEYANGELQILGRPPQPPAEKKPRPESKAAPKPEAKTAPAAPDSPRAPEFENTLLSAAESDFDFQSKNTPDSADERTPEAPADGTAQSTVETSEPPAPERTPDAAPSPENAPAA